MDPARKSRSIGPLLAFTFIVAAALTGGAFAAYWQIKNGYDEQAERRQRNSERISKDVRENYSEQMSRRLKGYAVAAAAVRVAAVTTAPTVGCHRPSRLSALITPSSASFVAASNRPLLGSPRPDWNARTARSV